LIENGKPNSFIARDSAAFVGSFPLSEARQAKKIRVTYHSGSHASVSASQ